MKHDPQHLQNQYARWEALREALETAQQQWQQADEILAELNEYYGSEQWYEDRENDQLQLDTGSHFSILDEDTLWEALQSRHDMALNWMRLGLDALDRE
ncbi:DUF4298 domain-containing protein [Uruburuella testudinis]|uniref:DUF4298 domain-containing protein n=1 Tax=Uruburuella testudinis TaxID=1282863 RepID=A0ABY4DS91_9NEIS|nr:DUF4298 domain-containing protein [Uruburuella testudinis]UOO81904.1 DUF4298 domain-containing protein [Uruburuella testudinis]